MHVRHALVTAALVAALVAVPTVLVVAHPAVATRSRGSWPPAPPSSGTRRTRS
jgi:hypothetical protein